MAPPKVDVGAASDRQPTAVGAKAPSLHLTTMGQHESPRSRIRVPDGRIGSTQRHQAFAVVTQEGVDNVLPEVEWEGLHPTGHAVTDSRHDRATELVRREVPRK